MTLGVDITPRLGLEVDHDGSTAWNRDRLMQNFIKIDTQTARYAAGALAARPAAATANTGLVYVANGGSLSISTGTKWVDFNGGNIDLASFVTPSPALPIYTDTNLDTNRNAIQAAVDAALAIGDFTLLQVALYVAPGHYSFKGHVDVSTIRIIGAGSYLSFFDWVGTEGESGFVTTGLNIDAACTPPSWSGFTIQNVYSPGLDPYAVVQLKNGCGGCYWEDIRIFASAAVTALVISADGAYSIDGRDPGTGSRSGGDSESTSLGTTYEFHHCKFQALTGGEKCVSVQVVPGVTSLLHILWSTTMNFNNCDFFGGDVGLEVFNTPLKNLYLNTCRFQRQTVAAMQLATSALTRVVDTRFEVCNLMLANLAVAIRASVAFIGCTHTCNDLTGGNYDVITWAGSNGSVLLDDCVMEPRAGCLPRMLVTSAPSMLVLTTRNMQAISSPSASPTFAYSTDGSVVTVQKHLNWVVLDSTSGNPASIVNV